MGKLIGVVILFYGIAGVVVSVVAYQRLRGPIQDLRVLLGLLAARIAEAGVAAKSAATVLVEQAKPVLVDIADVLGKVAKPLGETADRFATVAQILGEVGGRFNSFTVPTPVPVEDRLDLDVTLNFVSGISLTEYDALGFKLYGPPMSVSTTPRTILELGHVDIVTGIRIEDSTPLEPVGNAFDSASQRVKQVEVQLDEAKDRVEQTQGFIQDQAVPATDDAAAQLTQLGAELELARVQLDDLSQSRLLSVVPMAVIGYFALIHLAFAFTGLALIVV